MQWEGRGGNLFAVTSIVILLLEVVAVLILLKLIVQVISMICGTRGETICRLILNLMNYIAVIVFLFFALQYIGIDIESFTTSAGKGVLRILITAECNENDYRHVKHKLNHAIAELFDEHNIPIM